LSQAVGFADEIKVPIRTRVERGYSSAGAGIIAGAAHLGADLVVLGARPRRLEGRPYLGANVEKVLQDCDATVVVVIVPESWVD